MAAKKKNLGQENQNAITRPVIEWLSEVKLYKQKIDKTKELLGKSNLFYVANTVTKNPDVEDKTITQAQSLFQKYLDLTHNLSVIKQALMEFNATTKITVDGKEYSIARALELYRKDDDTDFIVNYLATQLQRYQGNVKEAEKLQTKEVSEFETKLLNGPGANKNDSFIKSQIDKRREDYKVYSIEAFNIVEQYQDFINHRYEFVNKVNAQINIANVENTLTIVLK